MSDLSEVFGIIDGAMKVLRTPTPLLTSRNLFGGSMATANGKPYVRGGLAKPIACESCGELFLRSHGRQKRCDDCRVFTCDTCGKQYIPAGGKKFSRFCSIRCKGSAPENIERLQTVRGVKPRTYHLRVRDKHGGAADKDWRTAVFERDDYTCQRCGCRGGRLQAHHIKPYKDHPELRHDLTNGETLCVECHKQTDSYGWSKYWHGRRGK